MSFNAFRENKILAKISEFTVNDLFESIIKSSFLPITFSMFGSREGDRGPDPPGQ